MIPPWFGTSNLKTFEGHGRGHFSFEAKPGRDPSIHCLTCVTSMAISVGRKLTRFYVYQPGDRCGKFVWSRRS